MDCSACGSAIDDGARFCPSCGHALLHLADERRVVTVLFADVVGFTSMSEGIDPEQVKRRVDELMDRLSVDIRAFGGVIDKVVGDGMLALFGAPTAHEDDPERAVRAGLRMQATVRAYSDEVGFRVRMRMGVDTGEVLVGAIRVGDDYTAMGDTVNTASRLQQAAAPGQVLVGAETRARTTDAIAYGDAKSLEVRGRAEPVEASVAIRPRLPPGYRPRRHIGQLVGRDSETALLGQAIDLAVERQRPLMICLVGEAGVGKSRLAEEVTVAAGRRHDAQLLNGRCVPYGEANVWWPLAEVVRQAASIEYDSSPAEARRLLRQMAFDTLDCGNRDGPLDAEVVEVVERVVNGLGHLLGHESPLRNIDARHALDEAQAAMLTMASSMTERRPLFVRLSDVHWADQVVFDTLVDLADRAGRAPIVLLLTSREPLLDRWQTSSAVDSLSFTVSPLDDRAAAELVQQRLPEGADPGLVEAVLDTGGGNPFFLEELSTLVGHPGVPFDESRPALPDNVRALVATRIDSLTPSSKRVLEDAAVWGRTGPVEVLTQVAELRHPGDEVDQILQSLVASDMLDLTHQRWSFRSDSIREVVYRRLTKGDRAVRHSVIAEHLQSLIDRNDPDPRLIDVIAHHWADAAELAADLGGVEGVPPSAAADAAFWLAVAGSQAATAELYRTAERSFGRALALAATAPPGAGITDELRLELLLAHGRALCELRSLVRARSVADEAVALAAAADARPEHAAGVLLQGDLAVREGRGEAAERLLECARGEFTALDDPIGEAECYRLVGMSALLRGAHERAEDALDKARTAFDEAGDDAGVAWATQNMAWLAFMTGRVPMAEEQIRTSVEVFTRLGDPLGLSWARGLLGYIRFYGGAFPEALDIAEEIKAGAEARGDEWGVAMMEVLMGGIALWTGDVSHAVDLSSRAHERFEASRDRFGIRHAGSLRGLALVFSGQVAEGIGYLDSFVSGRLDPTLDFSPVVVGSLAHAHVLTGAPHKALNVLEQYPEDADAGVIGVGDRLAAKSLALLQAGRVDEAKDCLERLAAVPDAPRTRPAATSIAAVAALLVGDFATASEVAHEVVGAHWRTRWDLMLAHLVLSSVAATEDDSAAALMHLGRIRTEVHASDDRLARAVCAVFEAELALRLETTTVVPVESQVFTGLGVAMTGWWELARACLEAVPATRVPAGGA